jgi:GTP-binding protein Era
MKTGFVGIIGRPNVGKSTLLNAILGEKIAITTDKPQTTRNSIRGIYTCEDSQIVFIDTPGIHKPKNKLGSYMDEMAVNTLREVDAVIFIVDSSPKDGSGDSYVLDKLKETQTPKILVINKIDKMPPEVFKETYDYYEGLGLFSKVMGISALEGKNVNDLLEHAKSLLEEGPMYFPPDMVTDHPERFIVSEIIREKALLYLRDEVPHGIAVEIEAFREGKDLTSINACIYCEKKSHKGIILGSGGKKIKGIGRAARLEIEGLLGTKVYLELWVKVKENWRDSDFALSNFGYKEN